ncbi:MAG: DsbA family protein, partial [Dongiaceae bacterium]
LTALAATTAPAQDNMSTPAADEPATTAAPVAAKLPAEPAELEMFIHDYLLAHPEIIIESVQRFQLAQQRLQVEQAAKSLVDRRQDLTRSTGSPVLGNPDGDVAVVEFFDYRCPYCKLMATNRFIEALEQDGNVRIVLKEWPILGPESEFAARAALAAHRQGKYRELHMALFQFEGKVANPDVLAIAERQGLDMDRLKTDMDSPEVSKELQDNRDLAKAIGVNGTPAFVIDDQLIPGAVDVGEIMKRIAAARQG